MKQQHSNDDANYSYGKDIAAATTTAAATITKVLTNPSEINKTLVEVFSNIQHTYDIVNDSTGVTVAVGVELIKNY